MASGSKFSAEEIEKMLEESDSDWDFSDSDEYLPHESDEDSSNTSGRESENISWNENEEEILQEDENSDGVEATAEPEPRAEPELLWLEDVLAIGREKFTGRSGVQDIESITDEKGDISVLQICEYFVSNDVIELMVNKTNNYANFLKNTRSNQYSRMKRWVDVSSSELKKFFALVLLMGIDKKPSIEHYWKMNALFYNLLFHEVSMSYNRFSSILRCWHFEDNQPHNQNILYKIQPFIDIIMAKFRSLYMCMPGDTIVVDEALVSHQGRLRIKTYIPCKASKYGIKIYKMCSVNSYTWSYIVYAGANSALEGLDKPGSVVVKLCLPLLNEGRLIIADNFYTSLSLVKYLKDRHTDLCGTLRKNKTGLPQEVLLKKLRKGEVVARQLNSYVTVLKWHDKRDVLMISSCHDNEMVSTFNWCGAETLKPKMTVDYNDAKKGIDVADQLSSYYSPLRKSMTWYKKIAYDLIFQAAIVNTRVIYNEITQKTLTILQIQEIIIRSWLGEPANKQYRARPPTQASSSTSSHRLTEIPRNDEKLVRKRCSACYRDIRAVGGNPLRAKQVNTECKIYNKALCLTCFNENH